MRATVRTCIPGRGNRRSHFARLAGRALWAACSALLSVGTGTALAEDVAASSDPAAMMRARYAEVKDRHADNPFHRPLYLDSSEAGDGIDGDVFALVDDPFATVRAALDDPSQWCQILILHFNVKYCRPSSDNQGTALQVMIGSKYYQPMELAHRLDFAYRVAAETASYLQVKLEADDGPLGTRNYRIVLEAAPAEEGRTFIRFSYSYSYGTAARLAMQAYLDTIGRDKVGFTVVTREPDGQPRYVGGMRGVAERNTMRYYLAIESFLGALPVPRRARMEKSLSDWFSATERYPRQLHEMERGEYLDMKRREYSRQQAGVTPMPGSVGGDGG